MVYSSLGGRAVPAARQVRNDYTKSFLERRDLKCPIRAVAAESMNEYQRFALTAFHVVQRKIFVAKKRHGRLLLDSYF